MQKIPMTIEGSQLLHEELNHLKSVERPKIVNAIAEARAHGDLKENAEYHAAKEQQGLSEARIRYIEQALADAQIIDITKIPNAGKVVFGTTVKLINTDNDQHITYKIVGDDEADIKKNKISIHSPIARALIGKQADDVIEITAPNGKVTYEIIAVEYV
jgi:transcription elongation factor GreA